LRTWTGTSSEDWHVARTLRRCRREQCRPIDWAPLRVGQSQAVPRQPHQHVGPGSEQVAQSLQSREAAVGELDLAGLHGKPVEPFAMLQ